MIGPHTCPGRRVAALLAAVVAALVAPARVLAEAAAPVDADGGGATGLIEARGVPDARPEAGAVDLGLPLPGARLPPPLAPRLPLAMPGAGARTLTAAAETLAVQGVVMGWNLAIGEARWAAVTPGSIQHNLRASWRWDDDAYYVNQLGHPYQGSFAHTAARSAGLGFWPSAAFPFASSALWELAGETEHPSLNDQITTPLGGVVVGEVLHRVAGWVRGDGRSGWRSAASTLLSPVGAVNRGLVRGVPREEPGPLRVEAGAGVLAAGGLVAGAPESRAPLLSLALTNGVPGGEELRYERPFDHFDASLRWAPTPDPLFTLRIRGLAAGRAFATGPRGGGLWGLWLGLDVDGPSQRRVSTTSIGLGATGRWALRPGATLEGTVVASAVPLGAAGVLERPPGSDRDYLFGPGAQGLLDLRLALGDRLVAGASLRQVLVVGAGSPGGRELHLDGEVSARVRLVGHHGVAATASRFERAAWPVAGPPARQGGSLVSVAWVWAADPPRPPAAREWADPGV